LVERVSVSTKRVVGLVPIGGAQVIDTDTIEGPSFRPAIGRPEVTENHDPTASDPDCIEFKKPAPLFEIEIDVEEVDITDPKAMVDEGAGVDEYTEAAEHVSV